MIPLRPRECLELKSQVVQRENCVPRIMEDYMEIYSQHTGIQRAD